jgi:tyrosyl-tRNA synthetase
VTTPADELTLLSRGCVDVLPEGALAERLALARKEGRPLTVKAGFDPTAPDIHLGHTVLLTKLAQFQRLGHRVQLLIGDFTARIGDPTGRSETRPRLTEADIARNTETYKAQVFKVLDEGATEVVMNSAWLMKLHVGDVIDLCARFNVAPMLTREDFATRYREGHPIAIHEFLYPLMQGYDSVALKPDVELGGQDQRFNLLVGRDLMRSYGLEPQLVMTLPLLEGTDGVRKMSKSFGNYIGVSEPPGEIFGKVMSISDDLMHRYAALLTDWDPAEFKAGHPMEAKKRLARLLAARFHGEAAAREAEEAFVARFSRGETPDDLEEVRVEPSENDVVGLLDLLTRVGLVPSKSEARRRVEGGAVQIDGVRVTDPEARVAKGGPYVVRAGKRAMKRVTVG